MPGNQGESQAARRPVPWHFLHGTQPCRQYDLYVTTLCAAPTWGLAQGINPTLLLQMGHGLHPASIEQKMYSPSRMAPAHFCGWSLHNYDICAHAAEPDRRAAHLFHCTICTAGSLCHGRWRMSAAASSGKGTQLQTQQRRRTGQAACGGPLPWLHSRSAPGALTRAAAGLGRCTLQTQTPSWSLQAVACPWQSRALTPACGRASAARGAELVPGVPRGAERSRCFRSACLP
jgi:hypothetical protein